MSKQPNIIFFFTDQQRWDTCGCYGQQLPVTPNLDKMAESGTRFENAFTCQPICGPARAALQSGKWPTETDCYRNHRHLPVDLSHTLAAEMQKAGYQTAYIGKWHLAAGPNANALGYDPDYSIYPVPEKHRGGYQHWLASDTLEFTSHSYDGHMFDNNNQARYFPVGRYRADVQTDWALEYIDSQNNSEHPFFLFLSYIEPHQQNDHDCYEGPKGSKQKFANFQIPGDLAGKQGDWVENYPDYLGCCNSLDNNLGRIQAKLNKMGVSDNTIIIYTSDHGSHFKTRNSEYKRACHDSCLRIPMVVSGPGFDSNNVVSQPVSLIDIPKTLLEAAMAEIPDDWRGIPLQQTAAGKNDREFIFAQLSESQTGRCIRNLKWKYSVKAPEGAPSDASDVYSEDFLYDLENDPHERCNLVKKPEFKSVRKQLQTILLQNIKKVEGTSPEIIPAV
ncbi:MAG: sulfatase-like hydrolase/transferase [Lentisphaerae bacterium]|nr:sulfatase-like hydrolase/transferase [Lentisphaerota bacterium]MCP4102242.1 sulfatase-like hydrolase/transferase [Lentisphaerota bacterium]